jgi:hypothetical protein
VIKLKEGHVIPTAELIAKKNTANGTILIHILLMNVIIFDGRCNWRYMTTDWCWEMVEG